MAEAPPLIWAWRHPAAQGATGRCIGHTDLPVDPRHAKRLARRIQTVARRQGLPRVVHTSALRRCADVGRWLRRWGWRHVIDPALIELDFGAWDGRCWHDIARAEVDAWCAGFMSTAPGGGGETLAELLARAACWTPAVPAPTLVVAHAGWMLARRWQAEHKGQRPTAATWPAAPAHQTLWLLTGHGS